ncbi:hypothetical protein SAMN05428949_0973 [Chitinophaga sp. YR627]|uniref:hypothetical protein n=1 Tax=Chitinophaga sp. YR627 TaxID=1881041 RepID=UPI0008EE7074|nr:hypothetical protein [Chitinophaga sp. YR627]SFM83545.1 hypothetical protein SAMN05428949_0973 [Chitinophaga sp. YR627]
MLNSQSDLSASMEVSGDVLDRIKYRISLLDEIHLKTQEGQVTDIEELQSFLRHGLWILGPEYDSIEYTPHYEIINVVRQFCGIENCEIVGSKPAFVILPDSIVGIYYLAKFDEEGCEIGVDRLTVVELVRSGFLIGDEQKSRAWRCMVELMKRALLEHNSKVNYFLLGSDIDPIEYGIRSERNGNVFISALSYSTAIERAKCRVLNLRDKIRNTSVF